MNAQGTIFVVTAPSGTGKTTLVAALLAADRALQLSVSYTTRAPRAGETPGLDYHFVDRETFNQLQARGDFLESAEVYGNGYATSERWLREQIAAGRDTILEIDWQGAAQVRQAFPEAVSIFILPPSLEVLEERLRRRATDSEDVILQRLATVRSEIDHVGEFDFVVFNQGLEDALRDLKSIVRATRLKKSAQFARHKTQIMSMQTLA